MHIQLQTLSYSYTDMHMHPCDMHMLSYSYSSIQISTCCYAVNYTHAFMYLLHLTTMQSYNYIHSCARIIALALTNALLHSRISTRSRCLARALSHSYYQLLCWTCSTLSIVSMHAPAYCNSFYCIIARSRLAQRFLSYQRMRLPYPTLSIVSSHALALLNAFYSSIAYSRSVRRFLLCHHMRLPCSTLSIITSHARRFLCYHRMHSPAATLSTLSSLTLDCCDAFYSIIACARMLQRFLLYHLLQSPASTLSILSSFTFTCYDAFLSIISSHAFVLPDAFHRLPCNAFYSIINCARLTDTFYRRFLLPTTDTLTSPDCSYTCIVSQLIRPSILSYRCSLNHTYALAWTSVRL